MIAGKGELTASGAVPLILPDLDRPLLVRPSPKPGLKAMLS